MNIIKNEIDSNQIEFIKECEKLLSNEETVHLGIKLLSKLEIVVQENSIEILDYDHGIKIVRFNISTINLRYGFLKEICDVNFFNCRYYGNGNGSYSIYKDLK